MNIFIYCNNRVIDTQLQVFFYLYNHDTKWRKTMKKMFIDKHISQFSCINSQCEDTCCGNWAVFVDKKSYERYESLDQEKSSNLLQFIEKNDPPTSESSYATIKLTSDGICSFLTEEKLCKIHMEYGFYTLCETCKIYPKTTKKINNEYYQTAYLSCPEMARIVLLTQIPFEWNVSVHENPSDFHLIDEVSINRNYMKKTHENIQSIFKQKQFSLSQRIWFIGIFISNLYVAIKEKKGTNKAITLAQKQVKKYINRKPHNDIETKMSFLLQEILKIENFLTGELMNKDITIQRFKECFILFKEGMKMIENENIDIKTFIHAYRQNHQTSYHQFFTEHMYILENYCSYYFQHELFPYNIKDLSKQYLLFVIEFSILKLFLVGISASSSGLNKNIVIQLFQTYSKLFKHHLKDKDHHIISIHDQLFKLNRDFYKISDILMSE